MPATLRRLPPSLIPVAVEFSPSAEEPVAGAGRLYERHEGGLLSRALGKAVHELFQHLAHLLVTEISAVARASLAGLLPRIAAKLRADGIDASHADRIAAQSLEIVLRAANDPQAQWILAPHSRCRK